MSRFSLFCCLFLFAINALAMKRAREDDKPEQNLLSMFQGFSSEQIHQFIGDLNQILAARKDEKNPPAVSMAPASLTNQPNLFLSLPSEVKDGIFYHLSILDTLSLALVNKNMGEHARKIAIGLYKFSAVYRDAQRGSLILGEFSVKNDLDSLHNALKNINEKLNNETVKNNSLCPEDFKETKESFLKRNYKSLNEITTINRSLAKYYLEKNRDKLAQALLWRIFDHNNSNIHCGFEEALYLLKNTRDLGLQLYEILNNHTAKFSTDMQTEKLSYIINELVNRDGATKMLQYFNGLEPNNLSTKKLEVLKDFLDKNLSSESKNFSEYMLHMAIRINYKLDDRRNVIELAATIDPAVAPNDIMLSIVASWCSLGNYPKAQEILAHIDNDGLGENHLKGICFYMFKDWHHARLSLALASNNKEPTYKLLSPPNKNQDFIKATEYLIDAINMPFINIGVVYDIIDLLIGLDEKPIAQIFVNLVEKNLVLPASRHAQLNHDQEAQRQLAKIHMLAENWGAAADWYDHFYSVDKAKNALPQLHLEAAHAYYKNGDYEDAVQAYKQAQEKPEIFTFKDWQRACKANCFEKNLSDADAIMTKVKHLDKYAQGTGRFHAFQELIYGYQCRQNRNWPRASEYYDAAIAKKGNKKIWINVLRAAAHCALMQGLGQKVLAMVPEDVLEKIEDGKNNGEWVKAPFVVGMAYLMTDQREKGLKFIKQWLNNDDFARLPDKFSGVISGDLQKIMQEDFAACDDKRYSHWLEEEIKKLQPKD